MKLTFYKKSDGTKPAGKYIKSLDTKHKAKVIWEIDLLEKQDNKTDPKELDIALKYMKDYIERKAKENENSKK